MTSHRLCAALVVCLCLGGLAITGCRDQMPHSVTWPAGGDITYTHAKVPEGGYYGDWDPWAKCLQVTHMGPEVNPVTTQHVLIATVRDKDGEVLPNRRVEWLIPEGCVGTFLEVDESGWRASRGYKVTNTYAVTHTNNCDHVLTRGTDDPADDIHLKRGQTWCVLTSATEGTTHVVVYAPGIYNWQKHKVFVKKHWYDVAWRFPPSATNPIGTPHSLTTQVTTFTDGKPLEGYEVTYKILSGPAGSFAEGGQTATVRTDANGLATATLQQSAAAEGTNDIQIDVVRPAMPQCCKPAVHLATGRTSKTWIGPRIAITKSAPATALVGDQFEYTMVVSNPSRVDATNVVVTDTLPDGIRYASSTPAARVRRQQLTWSLGTVAAGQTVGVRATVSATREGTFENVAEVTADFNLTDRASATTVVTQARLTLTKSAPAEVLLCDPIPLSFTVSNTGTAAATNVKFRDDLPNGLLYQGRQTPLTADVGTLAPGQSKTINFVVKASRPGTYRNTAGVTADHGLSAKANAKTIVRQPVLAVTKTGPAAQFIGREVTYDITVSNNGDGEAQNTTLVDTLPAGTLFVRASEGGRLSGGRVAWSLGTLNPGASRNVSVTIRPTRIGEIVNHAAATARCSKAEDKATTDVRGIPAILLECVDSPDPIEVGAQTTYTITVTNQGSAVGTKVVVTCTLPAQEQYVSATGPTQATVRARTVTFAPLESLATGAEAVYRVTAKGVAAGDVRFKVSLTSDQLTQPVMETEATNIYK